MTEDRLVSCGKRHRAIADCLFLVAVVLYSLTPYVGRLGFYSDDWATLADFHDVKPRSLVRLVAKLYAAEPGMRVRPVQILYLAALYDSFARRPLGYHLVNAIVMSCLPVLLYAVLRRLHFHRMMALTISVVYSLLPHFSTDRFWFTAFVAPLSCALCLMAILATIQATREAHGFSPSWTILAGSLACLSLLAYEVSFGLIILLPVLVILRSTRSQLTRTGTSRGFMLAASFAVLLIFITLGVKILLQRRYRMPRALRGHLAPHVWHLLAVLRANIIAMIAFDFGRYSLELPYTTFKFLRTEPSTMVAVGALGLGIAVFLYLKHGFRESPEVPISDAGAVGLVAAGVLLSLLGLTPFMIEFYDFVTLGADNRVAIAAAIGAAFVLIGEACLLSNQSRRSSWFPSLELLTAVICSCNYLLVNTTADFWSQASTHQAEVVKALRSTLPNIAPHSTLLIGGFCSYIGPAIVFETDWDTTGMVQLAYADRTIKADVVNKSTDFGPTGVVTHSYDRNTYPYSNSLLLVDLASRQSYDLASAADADRHLVRIIRGDRCPSARPGQGVPVF